MLANLCLHRQVGLAKAHGPRHGFALGIERKRAPFKNHLVLPTHQMRVNQGQTAIGHALAHALLSLRAFARMKRRGVQHCQHLRASVTRKAGRFVKPGVFANQQPHPRALNLEHPDPVAGGEITALVKHLVVGQFALVISTDHLPLAQHAGAVVAARHRHAAGAQAAAFGVTHHHMQPL